MRYGYEARYEARYGSCSESNELGVGFNFVKLSVL